MFRKQRDSLIFFLQAQDGLMVHQNEFADAGCILQNMMLEATEQGLGSVFIWGSSMVVNAVPDLKKALQIPEDYTAVSGIAVCYASEEVEPKE